MFKGLGPLNTAHENSKGVYFYNYLFSSLCLEDKMPLERILGKNAPHVYLCPFHSQRNWWERRVGTTLECLTLSRQRLLLYLQYCMGEL